MRCTVLWQYKNLTASTGLGTNLLALQVDIGRSVATGHRLIAHLDLRRHHHESLLNVSRVLRRGLHELDAQRISKLL